MKGKKISREKQFFKNNMKILSFLFDNNKQKEINLLKKE
jgi:hypothetical protein